MQDIPRLVVPLPSLSEQRAIASFLDREIAKINEMILKKERLIELLQEKRTALITWAVTKGFNPDAPMKDSGVEWLGEIPETWEIKRLRFIVHMKAGFAITSEELEDEGSYPVYGGNGLRGYTSSYTHEGDRVLVGRQGALCGNINYASGRFWASEHAVVITPIGDVHVRWLGELLRSMDLNQYSLAAAQPGLAIENIKILRVPFPPLREQIAIAKYLDRETEKIDLMVEKVEAAIQRMQELRIALISAAVTGKIDVREHAA